jgi:hypothetical protein
LKVHFLPHLITLGITDNLDGWEAWPNHSDEHDHDHEHDHVLGKDSVAVVGKLEKAASKSASPEKSNPAPSQKRASKRADVAELKAKTKSNGHKDHHHHHNGREKKAKVARAH